VILDVIYKDNQLTVAPPKDDNQESSKVSAETATQGSVAAVAAAAAPTTSTSNSGPNGSTHPPVKNKRPEPPRPFPQQFQQQMLLQQQLQLQQEQLRQQLQQHQQQQLQVEQLLGTHIQPQPQPQQLQPLAPLPSVVLHTQPDTASLDTEKANDSNDEGSDVKSEDLADNTHSFNESFSVESSRVSSPQRTECSSGEEEEEEDEEEEEVEEDWEVDDEIEIKDGEVIHVRELDANDDTSDGKKTGTVDQNTSNGTRIATKSENGAPLPEEKAPVTMDSQTNQENIGGAATPIASRDVASQSKVRGEEHMAARKKEMEDLIATTIRKKETEKMEALAMTLGKASNMPGQPLNVNSDHDLILEIIGNRIRDVMDRRYRWAESLLPKFFIPVRSNTTETGLEENQAGIRLEAKDFVIQFCCDCGEIAGRHDPERRWNPHCRLSGDAYQIKPKHFVDFIDIYGEYMMAVLEMFLYGAYLDDYRRIVAYNLDLHLRRVLSISILFLKSYGIETSMDILNRTRNLSCKERAAVTPRVRTLEPSEDFQQLMRFIGLRRPLQDMNMVMTDDRDARWVCGSHLYGLKPKGPIPEACVFGSNPDSQMSCYNTPMSGYRAVTETAERARDFYRLIPDLDTAVTRLYLNWELNGEEQLELTEAISKSSSVAVTVEITFAGKIHEHSISSYERGVNHGMGQILIAALQNKNIEVFNFTAASADYPAIYDNDELMISEHHGNISSIASFKRDVRSGRIALRAHVIDVDEAVTNLRRAVKGFHHLSDLELAINSVWDFVTIKFAEPEEVLKVKGQVEDKEYLTDGKVAHFFERRGFVDEVQYSVQNFGDNMFLHSNMLTDVQISFALSRDRDRIRKMLRDNKKLKKLKFENGTSDDPSQVYEAFKSLICNHPALESFIICQRQGVGQQSEFKWRNCQDPKKMEVDIQAWTNDRIGSMLQKYATSITLFEFHGLTEANANILERSFRPKKGPFKLKMFVVYDPHLLEPNAVEIVQKVILRAENIRDLSIVGEIPLPKKNAPNPPHVVYADMISALRSRVSDISVWGKGTDKMVARLSENPLSIEMPLLTRLSIEGLKENEGFVDPNEGYTWILSLLIYKTPLNKMPMTSQNGKMMFTEKGDLLYLEVDDDDDEEEEFGNDLNDAKVTEKKKKDSKKKEGTTLQRPARYLYQEYGIRPLKTLSFTGVRVTAEEWRTILQIVDWSSICLFKLHQRNPIEPAVLKYFKRYIHLSESNKMTSFGIQGQGSSGTEICECLDDLEEVFMHGKTAIELRRQQMQLNQLQRQDLLIQEQQNQERLLFPAIYGMDAAASEQLAMSVKLFKLFDPDESWRQEHERTLLLSIKEYKGKLAEEMKQEQQRNLMEEQSLETINEPASRTDPKHTTHYYAKDRLDVLRSTTVIINGYIV